MSRVRRLVADARVRAARVGPTGTLESVFLLQPTERGTDGMTLVRSMHRARRALRVALGLTRAQSALGAGRRTTTPKRLTAHNDAMTVGVELFEPEALAHFTAERDSLPGPKTLKLIDLAGQADMTTCRARH